MISSSVLTLVFIPALYALVKQWRLERGLEHQAARMPGKPHHAGGDAVA